MDYGSPPKAPAERKRQTSRSPSPFTKRQRISQSPASPNAPNRARALHSNVRPYNPPSAREPRRPTAAAPEDKARNRRLFGGILGIVSKSQTNTNTTRRPHTNTSHNDLRERKLAEQRRYKAEKEERDKILNECEEMRKDARFLKTKTKPVLRYRPYRLTREQEEVLGDQISDTEEEILGRVERWEESHPLVPLLGWSRLPSRRRHARQKSFSEEDGEVQQVKQHMKDAKDAQNEQPAPPPAAQSPEKNSQTNDWDTDTQIGLDSTNDAKSPRKATPEKLEDAKVAKFNDENKDPDAPAPAVKAPEKKQMEVPQSSDDEIETTEGVSLIY